MKLPYEIKCKENKTIQLVFKLWQKLLQTLSGEDYNYRRIISNLSSFILQRNQFSNYMLSLSKYIK